MKTLKQLPKTSWFSGFEKVIDLEYTHTNWGKFRNITAAWFVNVIYIIVVVLFLEQLLGFGIIEAIRKNPSIGYGWITQLTAGLNLGMYESEWMMFFFACIFAPIWEEAVFRNFVFRKMQNRLQAQGWVFSLMIKNLPKDEKAEAEASKKRRDKLYVIGVILCNAIIFGLLHGSIINILIQGVGGILLSWVFLKNNSYWSAVILHAIWNFMLIFGLPVFMS